MKLPQTNSNGYLVRSCKILANNVYLARSCKTLANNAYLARCKIRTFILQESYKILQDNRPKNLAVLSVLLFYLCVQPPPFSLSFHFFRASPPPFSVPPRMCLCFADVLNYICLLSFAAHKPPALSVTPTAAQKNPPPFL